MAPSRDRRQDLLLTLVMLGIVLTPSWFAPSWLAWPWQAAVLVLGLPALWLSWTHAPWQPTPVAELSRIVAHLQLGPEGSFADLGAGDGRLVVAVQRATGADCTGIEAAPWAFLAGSLRVWVQGRKGARMRWADLYRTDLSGFDAVYVWGTAYSVGTERFGAHMQRALRPGARLVSYHHAVAGLEPVLVDREGQRPIHVYVMGR